MVSLHSYRRTSLTSNRSSGEDSKFAGADDETSVIEPDQGNVLTHIISQLRPGADLSRVVLPTFILEPRSMLERITNFMAHPEFILPLSQVEDPIQRFISVVKFYLSGWHIRPPGVKKPLNPILGETFSCYWDFPDRTKGYYISEQTSHHPPKSSYFYMAPEHHIRIDGCLKPRSKFLGNSAASLMEGIAVLRFLNRGDVAKGERYIVTQPNMYARGILFGKMKYELGDHSFVRCPELGLCADIEFKTKGYFSGAYNLIGGTIKNYRTGETLYEIGGLWSGEMTIKDIKIGKKEVLFNATTSKHTPPLVRPLEEQDERESQKLWFRTTQAIKERKHDVATDEKTRIEDMQRDEAAKRSEDGEEWHPRLFRPVNGESDDLEEGLEDLDWILNAKIDGPTAEIQVEQILAVTPILPGQKNIKRDSVIAHSHQSVHTDSTPTTFPQDSQDPLVENRHVPDAKEIPSPDVSRMHTNVCSSLQRNKLEGIDSPSHHHENRTKELEVIRNLSIKEMDTEVSNNCDKSQDV
ncbi:Oxysterol-binding protein-like protein OBPa [Golovinomyces cichoracearum]|uniref:Oxysterol-binding protein-like protein OBPa n=1 Tax=Golovinomyces cichoracearum TaxID=62708 RepID=A0A420JA49_9PEZI|nr:Oxysterol-binding protein-like protein OBPa [Golovinomyces cichoracearum]